MHKVKVFRETSATSLERVTNYFLDHLVEEFVYVDLKYSISGNDSYEVFSAIIIYKLVHERKTLTEKSKG